MSFPSSFQVPWKNMVFYHKDNFNWIIPLSHNVEFEFIIRLQSWKFKKLNLLEGSDAWSKCTHNKKNSFSCFLLKLEHVLIFYWCVICLVWGNAHLPNFHVFHNFFKLEWRSQSGHSFLFMSLCFILFDPGSHSVNQAVFELLAILLL